MNDVAPQGGHLPECYITKRDGVCICPALRACEARVRDEALYDAAWVPLKGVGVLGVLGGESLVSAREVRAVPMSAERWVIHGHRYVAESDYERDIAAAREDERGKTIVSYDLMKQRKGYEQGQRDERERWEAEGPWFKSVVHQCCEDKETAYAKGRAAGLDAARDAVTAVLLLDECDDYLAASQSAIDALRGESNG